MDEMYEIPAQVGMQRSEIGQRLKRLRERSGMSVREVADALKRPASTYSSYEDKFKKPFLPMDLVNALVTIWSPKGVGSGEILKLAGVSDATPTQHPTPAQPRNVTDIAPREMHRDMPVYGMAAGSADGAFDFNTGEPIDMVRRPPRLSGVVDAYAVYVSGDSMSPWRESGHLAYVHPHQPVHNGDYVVMQILPESPGDAPKAYVKRLERRTSREIILRQYNPPRLMHFPNRSVVSLHRIMDWTELLGL